MNTFPIVFIEDSAFTWRDALFFSWIFLLQSSPVQSKLYPVQLTRSEQIRPNQCKPARGRSNQSGRHRCPKTSLLLLHPESVTLVLARFFSIVSPEVHNQSIPADATGSDTHPAVTQRRMDREQALTDFIRK
jgi:hypothetical protein